MANVITLHDSCNSYKASENLWFDLSYSTFLTAMWWISWLLLGLFVLPWMYFLCASLEWWCNFKVLEKIEIFRFVVSTRQPHGDGKRTDKWTNNKSLDVSKQVLKYALVNWSTHYSNSRLLKTLMEITSKLINWCGYHGCYELDCHTHKINTPNSIAKLDSTENVVIIWLYILAKSLSVYW